MKAMVIYDSKFGNTERIARTIAESLAGGEIVPVVAASDASESDLVGIDVLAVGGPTQGHGLSPALRDFLDHLPAEAVRDLSAVTFDTRLTWPRFLAGSAAAAGAKQLRKKGARLLVPPESFLVTGTEGPLVDGELERARIWAHEVCAVAGRSEREPVHTGL